MPETYPIPSYAVSLWVAGEDLWLAFPGQGPEGRGHSLKLPASAAGLLAAITILKARAKETNLNLGHRGTPVSYDIQNALSSNVKYKAWMKAMSEDTEAEALAMQELADLDL